MRKPAMIRNRGAERVAGEQTQPRLRERMAFTLIELLVVIAIIAILAAILMPVLDKAKRRAQEVECVSNLHQLMLAWRMYADDNKEFPPNEDYDNAYPRWVAGDMRGGTVNPLQGAPTYTGIDATNEALLVEPHYSCLGPYVSNPKIYKCPADLSTWGNAGYHEQPRVRSYSMSQAIGPCENGTLVGQDVMGHWMSSGNSSRPGGTPWKVFINDSQIVGISPSDLWVLIEEHPNSINDAAFGVVMPTAPGYGQWLDVPSTIHGESCPLAFADCHADIHKWTDLGNIEPIVWPADTVAGIGNSIKANTLDPDVFWLAEHTTCLASGAQHVMQP